MSQHTHLGQLSALQQLLLHLIKSIPPEHASITYHPQLPPLHWLYGRAAYLETYWIREIVQLDDTMTAKVRHLFDPQQMLNPESWAALPPLDHLLNWALELQDHNLMILANPEQLPTHPLLQQQSLLPTILQQLSPLAEMMVAVLTERQRQLQPDYSVTNPLEVSVPSTEHADMQQGHFRIGARDDRAAMPNELPTQIVELHAFRIDTTPVTNGAFLGFMQAGGYIYQSFWSIEGRKWLAQQKKLDSPQGWFQDEHNNWFGIGLQGPFDLNADDYVSGINYYEAEAYCSWLGTLGDERLTGAVIQHEYQWEVAQRAKIIEPNGRLWEMCANNYHHYTGYQAPEYSELIDSNSAMQKNTVKGGSLHSQILQKRLSTRSHFAKDDRTGFHCFRLVFPPSKMAWHK